MRILLFFNGNYYFSKGVRSFLSFPSKLYSSQKRVNQSFHAWSHWRRSQYFFSASWFAFWFPYTVSQRMGNPIDARWTRIWWVRPVRRFTSRSVYFSSMTLFLINSVFASLGLSGFLAVIFMRSCGSRHRYDSIEPFSSSTSQRTSARYVFLIVRFAIFCWRACMERSFFAIIMSPLVSLSRRWTIPGRSTPLMIESDQKW